MKVLLIDFSPEKNCQIMHNCFADFDNEENNLTVVSSEQFNNKIDYYLIHYDFIFFKLKAIDNSCIDMIQKYKSYSELLFTPIVFVVNDMKFLEQSKNIKLINFDYLINPICENDISSTIKQYTKYNHDMYFQNHKMAVKGTILNKLEHQWKQPLNFISTNLLNLEIKAELGKLEFDSVEKINDNISTALVQISDNISLLNKSFESSKDKTFFTMNSAIENNLALLEYKIKQNNIRLEKNYQNNTLQIHNYESDFSLKIVLFLLVLVECSIKEKEKNEEVIIVICYEENANKIDLSFSLNKKISLSYIVKMFNLEFFLIKNLLQKTDAKFTSDLQANNSLFKITYQMEN